MIIQRSGGFLSMRRLQSLRRLFSGAMGIVMALGMTFAVLTAQPLQSASAQEPPPGGAYIKLHQVTVTITDQVAVTKVVQDFYNPGPRPAEGTYLFPLPVGAAVSNLTMYINGQPVQAQILDAQQAQQIYTETVRRLRDPALLQYVGRSAIQANVFPIPAGEDRKIEITYSQVVAADNGLINYTYPLKTDYASPLPVQQVSVSMTVSSKDPISTLIL